MNNRRSKRAQLSFHADIISGKKTYKGKMENVSEEGLCHSIFSEDIIQDFIAGNMVEVRFQFPKGKRFYMYCEIKRVETETDPLVGNKYNLGMEIINSAPEYRKSVKEVK
jgi:hypothetical protein